MPRPHLPGLVAPLIFIKFNSDSAIDVGPSACQRPAEIAGFAEETLGSLESRRRRWPLILDDRKTLDRLFKGRGQGDIGEYKQMLVVEGWMLSHFLIKTETFFSRVETEDIGTSYISSAH